MGVAAVSASDVWAVGTHGSSSGNRALTERWNGSSWSIVKSLNAGSYENELSGVAVVAANDVWAVGAYRDSEATFQTLIEHWNGSSWSIVPSPSPSSSGNYLSGVTAVSASNIWAVGYQGTTLIEHWNGSNWSVVPSPSPGGNDNNFLISVATVFSNSVWAVGVYQDGSGNYQTLIEHWNGSSWSVVPSPNPGISYSALAGVVRVPTTHQVWAAGNYRNSSGVDQTLTEFHG